MGSRAGFLQALAIPGFRYLWLGQLVSDLGDNVALLAFLFLVKELTGGSAIALGAVAASTVLPVVSFGLLAGAFVDRLDRKWTMIVSDVLRGLAVLLMLLVREPGQMWIVFLVAFTLGLLGAFFSPARNASLPNLVPPHALLAANALSQTTHVVLRVVGPGMAGLIIERLGLSVAFALDAASFFVSALFIAALTIPRREESPRERSLRTIVRLLREGLVYIGRDRVLVSIMAAAGVGMLGLASVSIVGVTFLDRAFGVRADGFGFLLSVQGVGMIVGGVLVGNFTAWLRARWIVVGGVVLLGLAFMGFGAAPRFDLVLILAFIIGLAVVTARSALAALIQALVPDEKRGRVESAINTIVAVSSLAAFLLSGVLGELVGLRAVFVLSGLLTVLVGLGVAYTLSLVEADVI